LPKDVRKAWDAETMGYGKHTYTVVDPDAINVEDFAVNMRGDEQHRGDVREENTAYNERQEDNTVTLDLLSKIGTVFTTEAPGLDGTYIVVGMPIVRSPEVFARVSLAMPVQNVQDKGPKYVAKEEEVIEMSCVELGCAVDVGNKFRQVGGEILAKGKHQNLG